LTIPVLLATLYPFVGQTAKSLNLQNRNSHMKTKSSFRKLATLTPILLGAATWLTASAFAQTTVFQTDFNSGVSPQISGAGTLTSVQNYAGLGIAGNVFSGNFLQNDTGCCINQPGATPGQKTVLTLTGLPSHTTVSLRFLLAIIGSWDGSEYYPASPDYFNVAVGDGNGSAITVFRDTFNTEYGFNGNDAGLLDTQGYPRGANQIIGPTGGLWGVDYLQEAYDMGMEASLQNIAHTSSTLVVQFWADGAGWQGGGQDESWAIDNLEVLTDAALPDLVAMSLAWDAANAGVNFSYAVSNTDLTLDTTAALYWATGPTWADVPAGSSPAYSMTIERLQGTYGPYYVPNAVLGTPPQNATHLLLVVDPPLPNGLVAESDENNNVFPLELKPVDIAMVDATTTDFQHIDVTYSVAGSEARAFIIRAYISTDDLFDPSDLPLAGQLGIADLADRDANPDGSAKEHSRKMTLAARAPVGDDHRFVIVVADPDEVLREADESNNSLFVIPLFVRGEKMNREGVKTTRQLPEATASGPFTGAILPGTTDWTRLIRLDSYPADPPQPWGTPPFIFQESEPLPYQKLEDRLAQPSILQPLRSLRYLITLDWNRRTDLWEDSQFRINEAYDSVGEHPDVTSLHYEGRALDFSGAALGNSRTRLGRLAGLVWLAGFDWVWFEPTSQPNTADHIHASAQASFATTIDQDSLQQAVQEALALGLIDNAGIANALNAHLDGVDHLLSEGKYLLALNKLRAFSRMLSAQAGRHIRPQFAQHLLLNSLIYDYQILRLVARRR
jgi:hypothetical protein